MAFPAPPSPPRETLSPVRFRTIKIRASRPRSDTRVRLRTVAFRRREDRFGRFSGFSPLGTADADRIAQGFLVGRKIMTKLINKIEAVFTAVLWLAATMLLPM